VIRTNVYCRGLLLRGEDIILSSSPQEAAQSDCKTASGHLPGGSGQLEKESDKVPSVVSAVAPEGEPERSGNSRSAAKNKSNRQQKN
jgi:hypothetical protein